MAKEKVILAYSGGLDTTVIIPWLKENYDYDVIAVCIDVGQGDDWKKIKDRALKTGASACYVVDARKEYMNGCILSARKGTVLIGAFINEYEKQVRDEALHESLPVIQLCYEQFSNLYKPSGNLFDACTMGHLLLLHEEDVSATTPTARPTAPSLRNPYWESLRKITREQCKALNALAEELASDKCKPVQG